MNNGTRAMQRVSVGGTGGDEARQETGGGCPTKGGGPHDPCDLCGRKKPLSKTFGVS